MRRNHQLNTSGAVSMISIVIFTTIITIVVLAYAQTIGFQQRQAIQHDFSTRAYYAAESGVQDAIRAIRAGVPEAVAGQDTCKTASGNFLGGNGRVGDVSLNLGYTCQFVNPTPQNITEQAGVYSLNKLIRLQPDDFSVDTGNYDYRLTIRWSRPTEGVTGPLARRSSSRQFLQNPDWYGTTAGGEQARIHSVLRVGFTDLPRTGTFGRSDIRQQAAFLNPTHHTLQDGSGTMTITAGSEVAAQNMVNNAVCYDPDETKLATHGDYADFLCKRSFHLEGYNLSQRLLFLKVGALYEPSDFDLSLRRCPLSASATNDTGCSGPLSIANVQARIDVTGRAGDTYRRIQQTVNLYDNSVRSTVSIGLAVGEGICKNFTIGVSANSYNSGCNPADPDSY